MRRGITFVAAVALLATTACGTGAPGTDDGRLRVVATTTQVGSVAREIGGSNIALTVLLPPGAEAHDYEMTPAAAAAVEDADLVLRSGAGLEGWLDDALETIRGDTPVADLSEGIELRETAEDSHAGEGPGQGDDGEGDAHAVDPHYWLSGPNAIIMVGNAEAALRRASPEHAGAFADRAAELVARLESADAEIRDLLADVPDERRGIVTNHDALGYFIDEYGLRFVGSVFPNLDVASEPSPGELAELIETIEREGVVAIFSESAVNPELAEALAAETSAEVAEGTLYTDSLGPPGSGADTLDRMLLHNAGVIHAALTPR